MKKYTFLLLTMQIGVASQDMTFEKDAIEVRCKKGVQKTQFADLSIPTLYHITITNNNTVPCFIDSSVLIKNRLIDESALKRDIVHMLQKRNRTKSIAYGCGSLVFASISLIALYKFYNFYSSSNTDNNNQVFGGSQGSLNTFSRPNLNLFNTQAPSAQEMQNNMIQDPIDLLSIKNEFINTHVTSNNNNQPTPTIFNPQDSFINNGMHDYNEVPNANYAPQPDLIDLIMITNTLTSPLALCSLTLFFAKKYFDKAQKTSHAYLNFALLSQQEPMIVAPGCSVEKIFALEDTDEPIIINGDGIHTPKNFWSEMTKFFSKKK